MSHTPACTRRNGQQSPQHWPATCSGSVAAGAHVVARTFLSGLAAELQTVVPPTTGGTDRVKEFDERFFGMDIEAALNKITELNHEAFAQGLRESTQATYDSGVRSYEYFCGKYGFRPYPTCEKTLIAFVGWSAVRVTVGSINNYLSGIRSKHIECDLPWVNRSEMPQLVPELHSWSFSSSGGCSTAYVVERLVLAVTCSCCFSFLRVLYF